MCLRSEILSIHKGLGLFSDIRSKWKYYTIDAQLPAVVKNGGRAKKKVHGAASSFWKGWKAKEAH